MVASSQLMSLPLCQILSVFWIAIETPSLSVNSVARTHRTRVSELTGNEEGLCSGQAQGTKAPTPPALQAIIAEASRGHSPQGRASCCGPRAAGRRRLLRSRQRAEEPPAAKRRRARSRPRSRRGRELADHKRPGCAPRGGRDSATSTWRCGCRFGSPGRLVLDRAATPLCTKDCNENRKRLNCLRRRQPPRSSSKSRTSAPERWCGANP